MCVQLTGCSNSLCEKIFGACLVGALCDCRRNVYIFGDIADGVRYGIEGGDDLKSVVDNVDRQRGLLSAIRTESVKKITDVAEPDRKMAIRAGLLNEADDLFTKLGENWRKVQLCCRLAGIDLEKKYKNFDPLKVKEHEQLQRSVARVVELEPLASRLWKTIYKNNRAVPSLALNVLRDVKVLSNKEVNYIEEKIRDIIPDDRLSLPVDFSNLYLDDCLIFIEVAKTAFRGIALINTVRDNIFPPSPSSNEIQMLAPIEEDIKEQDVKEEDVKEQDVEKIKTSPPEAPLSSSDHSSPNKSPGDMAPVEMIIASSLPIRSESPLKESSPQQAMRNFFPTSQRSHGASSLGTYSRSVIGSENLPLSLASPPNKSLEASPPTRIALPLESRMPRGVSSSGSSHPQEPGEPGSQTSRSGAHSSPGTRRGSPILLVHSQESGPPSRAQSSPGTRRGSPNLHERILNQRQRKSADDTKTPEDSNRHIVQTVEETTKKTVTYQQQH